MVLLEAAILGGALSTKKGRRIGKKIIDFPSKVVQKERQFLDSQFKDKQGKELNKLLVG